MLETTLLALADRFSYSSTAPESVAGGLANIRDMSEYWDMPSPLFFTVYILVIYIPLMTMPFCAAFLTELCDTDLLSSRRLGKKHSSNDSTEGRTIEVYINTLFSDFH